MNLKEIKKLSRMLDRAGIPHEDIQIFDGYQVNYPNKQDCICDAICHSFSYGHEKGLLEIMGLTEEEHGDDVQGNLTAKEVFKRIKKHYNKNFIVVN